MQEIADMLVAFENEGTWGLQLWSLRVVLQRKPEGGDRDISLTPVLHLPLTSECTCQLAGQECILTSEVARQKSYVLLGGSRNFSETCIVKTMV